MLPLSGMKTGSRNITWVMGHNSTLRGTLATFASVRHRHCPGVKCEATSRAKQNACSDPKAKPPNIPKCIRNSGVSVQPTLGRFKTLGFIVLSFIDVYIIYDPMMDGDP